MFLKARVKNIKKLRKGIRKTIKVPKVPPTTSYTPSKKLVTENFSAMNLISKNPKPKPKTRKTRKAGKKVIKNHRSFPFFNALLKAPSMKRMNILQSFPNFVVDDLLNIILKVVKGKIKISKSKKHLLSKHRKPLLSLVNNKNRKQMRKIIYKQQGGFIGALIPLALSLLGGVVGNQS